MLAFAKVLLFVNLLLLLIFSSLFFIDEHLWRSSVYSANIIVLTILGGLPVISLLFVAGGATLFITKELPLLYKIGLITLPIYQSCFRIPWHYKISLVKTYE